MAPAGSPHDLDRCQLVADHRRSTGAGQAAGRPTVEADSRSDVIAALVAGLLAGYGIAMPVGAVGTYLVALTARTSLRIGICAALGVATADGLYALIAVLGGSALTPVLQPIMLPMRCASALVLIALAVRGGVAAISQYRRRQTSI